MSDAGLASKINAAAEAIQKLPAGRSSKELKMKVIRGLYASITQARLRGVALQSITKSVHDKTGVKISHSTLLSYLKAVEVETEEAAQRINRTISNAPGSPDKPAA